MNCWDVGVMIGYCLQLEYQGATRNRLCTYINATCISYIKKEHNLVFFCTTVEVVHFFLLLTNLLDALNGAVALLETDKVAVELGDLLPRHLVQGVLVDHAAM